MKATGEVMSICTNFEGGLMKAIRSLEQHVDSLMSYDFPAFPREELKEAESWMTAGSGLSQRRCAAGISYEDDP